MRHARLLLSRRWRGVRCRLKAEPRTRVELSRGRRGPGRRRRSRPPAPAEPPGRDLYSVRVATMTRVETGIGGVVVSATQPRGFARPECLDLPLGTLPGVGPSLLKKLRPLGLETVGDLLLRRPRRYEAAADEVAISDLWGDDETVIAGVVQGV